MNPEYIQALAPIVRRSTTSAKFAGIAVVGARPGETAMIRGRALVTSDDGPHVYGWLESMIHTEAFAPIFAGLPIELVTNVLINVADGNVTGWINHLPATASIAALRDLRAGEPVRTQDIAHIGEIVLEGVDPEPNRGSIVYVARFGWRLGLYFDFKSEVPSPPLENLRTCVGQVHTMLTLRDRIRFDILVLRKMYEQGWFPFVGLPPAIQQKLYLTVQNGWPITDEIEQEVINHVSPRMPAMIATWKQKEVFEPHITRLTSAARLFRDGDCLSAHSVAFPVIEGVLRRSYLKRASGNPDYKALRLAMVKESWRRISGRSALLPEEFSEYIDVFFLAPFDLDKGIVPPSRHSTAHGVASDEELSKPVHTARIFLTLEQLFHCL
jgi:hypothetical protein